MDFFAGQGARRRHSPDYGNDEQRRHAEKDAALCFDIYDSRHESPQSRRIAMLFHTCHNFPA
jgi:hypothetical protein